MRNEELKKLIVMEGWTLLFSPCRVHVCSNNPEPVLE